tara:strand:- start:113 stop:568 length:456 start_codon:yes stop_codon:yes gene_type:complete
MERYYKKYSKEDLMKLLIYSGKEKFVSSGIDSKTQVIEGTELSQTIESAYSTVEAFDFIESAEYENPLDMLLSRLRQGGTLSMQGLDAVAVSSLFIEGKLDSRTFSDLMVSSNKRVVKVGDIIKHIESKNGYEIQFAGISGLHYIVEVTRV